MKRALSVLSIAIGFAACSNPVEVSSSDIVSARAEAKVLTITNTSDDPVYYFVADREALALLDWAVCRDPSTCKAIAPHSSKRIIYSEIAAYQTGSGSAVVFHWKLFAQGSGGYNYDSVRELVVKLN